MSDSIKKYQEDIEDDLYWKQTSTLNVRTMYPGDIKIYESPDKGKTVKSRPLKEPPKRDIFVELVKSKYDERSQRGMKKYGTNLERNDLNIIEWLNHLQEELMDATLYVEKLKADIGDKLRDR